MKYTALLVTLALTGVFASGCLAAETEAEMQTEKEAVVRQQKNGFDEAQTELVEIGGFTVKIPSYWQAEEGEISLDGSDQEYYCAYAERQGKVALLQMEANVDDQESVTFSLLEDEEQEIAQAFGQSFDTYDCSQSELYELKGSETPVKGYLWTFTFSVQGQQGDGQFLMFPAEEENRWMQVLMMQTDNTEFDYTGDFQKILESIRNEKDSAVYYRTTTTINIRSAPDETDDTNKLGKVPENTVVKADLTGEVNERWVKVTYTAEDGSSIDGWVSKDYVEQTWAPEPEAETE